MPPKLTPSLLRIPESLLDFLSDVPRHSIPSRNTHPAPLISVRDTIQAINDANVTGDDPSIYWTLLNDRTKVQTKLLKFKEDVRPGYIGKLPLLEWISLLSCTDFYFLLQALGPRPVKLSSQGLPSLKTLASSGTTMTRKTSGKKRKRVGTRKSWIPMEISPPKTIPTPFRTTGWWMMTKSNS